VPITIIPGRPLSSVSQDLTRLPSQWTSAPRDEACRLRLLTIIGKPLAQRHADAGGSSRLTVSSSGFAATVVDVLDRLPAAVGAEFQAVGALAGDGQRSSVRSRDWRTAGRSHSSGRSGSSCGRFGGRRAGRAVDVERPDIG